jgi:hypothetical protein
MSLHSSSLLGFLVVQLVACKDRDAVVAAKIDRALHNPSLDAPGRVLGAAELAWPADVCIRNLRLQRVAGRQRLLVECFRSETPATQLEGGQWVITVFQDLAPRGPEEKAEQSMLRLLGRGIDELVVVDRWKVFVDGRLVTIIGRPRLTHPVGQFQLQIEDLEPTDVSELAPYDLVMFGKGAVLPMKPPQRTL